MSKVNPNILTAADTTALAALGRPDALQVLVTGVGIFNWESTGTSDGINIINATGGGRWVKKLNDGGRKGYHELTMASTIDVDCNDGPLQTIDLDADALIDISNPSPGSVLVLRVMHVIAETEITNIPGRLPFGFFWATGANEITRLGGIWNDIDSVWEWSFEVLPDPDYTPDVTAPLISSITAVSSSVIRVVFNEIVNATEVGWSFDNGGSVIPTGVTGSGTNTLDFIVSGLAYGDTITASYDQITGDTVDDSGNELADQVDIAVTNDISATAVDLAFATRTGLTKTGTVFTPTSNNASWGNTGLDALSLAAGVTGRIWFKYGDNPGSLFGLLGFHGTNAETVLASIDFSIYIYGASPYHVYGQHLGTPIDSGYVSALNEYYALYRDGATGTIKIQKSTDQTTWTDIATFGTTSTAKLYVVCNVYGAAGGQLIDPKGQSLT